jgi:hypothetical protein
MWRYLLFGLAALALAACDNNHLTSRTPVLFKADGAGLPKVRDGVWGPENGCDYDAATPVSHWPACIDATVVRGGRAIFPEDMRDPALKDLYGLQLGPSLQLAQDGPGDNRDSVYRYYGVEVLDAGPDGRPTRVRSYSVLCGPPPPDGSKTADGKTRTQTLEPYPGVVLDENGCAPKGRAGLIAAALADRARADADPDDALRWIREERPGDTDPRAQPDEDEVDVGQPPAPAGPGPSNGGGVAKPSGSGA